MQSSTSPLTVSSTLAKLFVSFRLFELTILCVLLSCVPPVAAQTDQEVVASVNGRKITQAEVDESVMGQILPLKQQIYALRKTAVENLIVRALLEEEAMRRGMAVDDLKRQLTSGAVNVSPKQIEEVYRENVGAFGVMSSDEAKERIRLDLESQARMQNYRLALSALKDAAKIRVSLAEPRVSINSGTTSPIRGPKDALITITEFSDFECPYCRETRGAIRQVLAAYPDKVRVVFKHLPLDTHAQAFTAARAAFCAGEENRFWQFHDELFAANELTTDSLEKIASGVGLSGDKFKVCINSEASRAAVVADLNQAKRLGINSTPTFVINGRLLRGALTFESLKQIIDQELELISNATKPAGAASKSEEKK